MGQPRLGGDDRRVDKFLHCMDLTDEMKKHLTTRLKGVCHEIFDLQFFS